MRRSRRAMLILRYNLWEFYFSRLTVLRIHGHCSENLTSLLRVAIEEMIIVMKTTLWGKLVSDAEMWHGKCPEGRKRMFTSRICFE